MWFLFQNEVRYIFVTILVFQLILFLFELITRYKRKKIVFLHMQEPTHRGHLEENNGKPYDLMAVQRPRPKQTNKVLFCLFVFLALFFFLYSTKLLFFFF